MSKTDLVETLKSLRTAASVRILLASKGKLDLTAKLFDDEQGDAVITHKDLKLLPETLTIRAPHVGVIVGIEMRLLKSMPSGNLWVELTREVLGYLKAAFGEQVNEAVAIADRRGKRYPDLQAIIGVSYEANRGWRAQKNSMCRYFDDPQNAEHWMNSCGDGRPPLSNIDIDTSALLPLASGEIQSGSQHGQSGSCDAIVVATDADRDAPC